ncbi:MAG: hypothetical protein H6834_05615 [Planctomycetes bacterium]|nr:hypothetical protein [Planctomycetota bacterium]
MQRHLLSGRLLRLAPTVCAKFLRRRQFEVGVTAILLAILIIGFVLTWSAMNTSCAAERAETVARIDELGTSDALRAAFVIERARAPGRPRAHSRRTYGGSQTGWTKRMRS